MSRLAEDHAVLAPRRSPSGAGPARAARVGPGPAPEVYLPMPPTDRERDRYLGAQRRWLPVAGFAGYMLIMLSVTFFIIRHPVAVLLFIPLAISFISALLSLITTTRRRRVTLTGHRALVDTWHPSAGYPSVDVFLPSAGENVSIIANTMAHVSHLGWSGALNVYVLDDSGREDVRELAARHDFHYLSRPNRGELKKAGNLLYGYNHSAGDLIAIFDADFVPRSDFLDELVPYFDDPTVGITQSPQFFDLDRSMNWLQRAAGATQVLFYRYVQPGRDASRAAICVGTSAVYRRSALAASGGFAQISHSEDVHTGINMMAGGYEVRYIPTIVSKGVCPDTLNGFVVQQYRWCGGSMALLLSGRFKEVTMTRMQRACYWSGFTYYISTALDIVISAVPTLLMAFFFADRVRVQNYVFVVAALIVRQTVVPFITGESDSLIGLARIQTTYSFAHLVRLYDLIRHHEDTEGWVATGAAGGTTRAKRIMRLARIWLSAYQILLWGAIAVRLPQYGIGQFWPMIGFALFNLYVAYPIIRGTETLPRVQATVRRVIETGTLRKVGA